MIDWLIERNWLKTSENNILSAHAMYFDQKMTKTNKTKKILLFFSRKNVTAQQQDILQKTEHNTNEEESGWNLHKETGQK